MSSLHVLLFHGADRLPFPEDLEQAKRRGAVAHALDLPANTGHPINDGHSHYDDVSDIIGEKIDSIKRDAEEAVIAAIGRNLGGSLLAYHAARHGTPEILVMTGGIPDLARFRAESDHEGARKFRERMSGPSEQASIMTLADLDLVSTLQDIPKERCLLQVGKADPWMDEGSWKALDQIEKNGFVVERLEDDHAMVSEESLERRWTFIERMSQ